jgi:hypothetical protein
MAGLEHADKHESDTEVLDAGINESSRNVGHQARKSILARRDPAHSIKALQQRNSGSFKLSQTLIHCRYAHSAAP